MSSDIEIVQSESNKRNVLVIMLGWGGSNLRHLSKYNKVYKNYKDYIDDKNKHHDKEEDADGVQVTIKHYIAPVHVILINFCLLKKLVNPIVNAIQNHRELHGLSSYIIIHSFSTAGSLMLCALNDLILKNNDHLLCYDGIIYDSPHLGPLRVLSAILVMWELLKLNIIPCLSCYDGNVCGWLYIWYYIVYIVVLILFLIVAPVVIIVMAIYFLITCSVDFVWCHDKKLLRREDIRILGVPMLLLGSNTDHINPIQQSIKFVEDKMDKMEQYKHTHYLNVNDDEEAQHLLNGKKYDSQYIKDSNRYYVFENSQHVKHHLKYPNEYQREVNDFLNLCLSYT